MSIASSFKGSILKSVIDKVAKSEPRTTIAGAVLGGLVAANIDYGKLVQGDPQQIGNAIGAVVTVMLGWWANHRGLTRDPNPPTT